MRVLAIETSGVLGSVALSEGGRALIQLTHSAPNRHAEETLPLVERALAEVGWSKNSLDRVAAGRGPGSFTGVRVGLSVASGLSLGLGIPALGVGSLRTSAALAYLDTEGRLAGRADAELLWVLRDARRDEYFFAGYDAEFTEIEAPCALAKGEVEARIAELSRGRPARRIECEPEARALALLAERLVPELASTSPEYVRDAGATPQKLAPSPLLGPRKN